VVELLYEGNAIHCKTSIKKEVRELLSIKTDEGSKITGWPGTAIYDMHMYIIG
jgi:hypothetical protein